MIKCRKPYLFMMILHVLLNYTETSLSQGLALSDVLELTILAKPTGLSIIKDIIPIYKLAKYAWKWCLGWELENDAGELSGHLASGGQ